MAHFVLYIFPAADGLKKSYQLLIGLNENHNLIPDIHVLQVVVVERVQRSYPQYLKGKYLYSYCSQFVLLCFYTEWLFWHHAYPVGLPLPVNIDI